MNSPWHIIGVGAIGGLFACRLREAGAEVVLISPSDKKKHRNLELVKKNKRSQWRFMQQVASTENPITNLLICTKSWAAKSALASVANRLTAKSTVVLLCNGMGVGETLLPMLENRPLAIGSTTAGCRKDSSGVLNLAGEGNTCMGWITSGKPPPIWQDIWSLGVPEFTWTQDIYPVLLEKTALNAVINPLTAVNRVANGELYSASMVTKTKRVIYEVQSLLEAAGELPDQARGRAGGSLGRRLDLRSTESG